MQPLEWCIRIEGWHSLARSQNLQPMQRDWFGLERFYLDFGCWSFGALTPAINAWLGLFAHVAACWTQEVSRVIERSSFARRRPRERFHGIAAQEFWPVTFK